MFIMSCLQINNAKNVNGFHAKNIWKLDANAASNLNVFTIYKFLFNDFAWKKMKCQKYIKSKAAPRDNPQIFKNHVTKQNFLFATLLIL